MANAQGKTGVASVRGRPREGEGWPRPGQAVGVLLSLLLSGCAASFADLPGPDRERFQACLGGLRYTGHPECRPDAEYRRAELGIPIDCTGLIPQECCLKRAREAYAGTPVGQRKAWLRRHGCAPSSGGAQPGQVPGGSGGPVLTE